MKLTLSGIVAWGVGIMLIMSGLAMLVSGPGGLLIIAAGLFAIPRVRSEITERTDIEFSRWVVVAIVFLGVVIGAATLPSDAPSPDENDPGQAAVGGDEPAGTEAGAKEHQTGETFTVGSGDKQVEYTVTDVKTASNVGGEYGEDADAQFVIVTVEMTNNAQESFSVSTEPYRLVDSQDRKYEVDTDAQGWAENSILYEQLDPGVTKTGVLIFDVPEDQSERKLRIEPAGMFSTADAHVVVLA